MVSQSAVNVMYRIKPVFEVPTSFKNTSSMYKLQPIKYKYLPNFQNNINSNDEIESKVDPKVGKSTAAKIESLTSRQEQLLQNLNELRQKISSFREHREQNSPQKCYLNVEKLEHTTVGQKNVKPSCGLECTSENVMGPTVTLRADPRYPPYCILPLLRLGIIRMTISIVAEDGNSISSLPEHALQFMQLLKNIPPVNSAEINISLIWKEVDRRCQLAVSSEKKNVLIYGETNILRYLGREYAPYCNVACESFSDYVLDLVTRLKCVLNIAKKNRNDVETGECSLILKQLERHLGNNKWFVNGSRGPSIADAAVWSAYILDKDVFTRVKLPKLAKWADSFY